MYKGRSFEWILQNLRPTKNHATSRWRAPLVNNRKLNMYRKFAARNDLPWDENAVMEAQGRERREVPLYRAAPRVGNPIHVRRKKERQAQIAQKIKKSTAEYERYLLQRKAAKFEESQKKTFAELVFPPPIAGSHHKHQITEMPEHLREEADEEERADR